MKAFQLFWLSAAIMVAVSCGNSESNGTEAMDTDSTAAAQVTDPSTGSFGEAITDEGAIPAADVLTMLADNDSVTVKLAGTVGEVCQMKGCWMTMDLGNGESMTVKFKDYAFFVPMDCGGKEAVMEGVAKRTVVGVDELRHLAEDAGKSAEEVAAITEPEETIEFMASGVIIR